jgi:hypothetical protein
VISDEPSNACRYPSHPRSNSCWYPPANTCCADTSQHMLALRVTLKNSRGRPWWNRGSFCCRVNTPALRSMYRWTRYQAQLVRKSGLARRNRPVDTSRRPEIGKMHFSISTIVREGRPGRSPPLTRIHLATMPHNRLSRGLGYLPHPRRQSLSARRIRGVANPTFRQADLSRVNASRVITSPAHPIKERTPNVPHRRSRQIPH